MAYLYRYLDTNGDGSGTKQATGDYSTTPTSFYIKPANGDIYLIERAIVHIRDSAGYRADRYGDMPQALTNGIEVKMFRNGNVSDDLTDGIPVKVNADWGRLCYDVSPVAFGAGNDFLQARWTFAKSGQPLKLGSNQSLHFMLNDDFTRLIEHTFMIQGISLNRFALYSRRFPG